MNPCQRVIPAHLVMFTDHGSIGHLMMGAIAGIVPPPWNVAAVAMFTGYEVSKLNRGESPERTGAAALLLALGVKL